MKIGNIFIVCLVIVSQGCSHNQKSAGLGMNTAVQAEIEEQKGKSVIRKVVEDNVFTTNRGLKKYLDYFGNDFATDLESLSANQQWIDGGAGSANAQKDFLKARIKNKKPIPKLTSITVKYPADQPRKLSNGKFEVFADRYFEVIPDNEFKAADIITDVVGILNYTDSLDIALEKYLRILKPLGKIYVFIPSGITQIQKKDGQVLDLIPWINSISGLRASFLSNSTSPYPQQYSFVIEKSNSNIVVPKLKLQTAIHRNVVVRHFVEI